MISFTNLKLQYDSMRDEINRAINRVLSSGWYILGEEVNAFEKEFADYIGVKYGVGVSSGTEAIYLALLACGIGKGDEVITVAHTAVATVAAIEMAGARPVFVDIEPRSCSIDPQSIEAVINSQTKAIIPVHLYGHPAQIQDIQNIANRFNLRLIEDCAQAHGAAFKGQRVGSFGDIGCFSFYPTKNLGAYGDGGIVVTDDSYIFNRLLLIRQYGWEKRYESSIKGINSRLDELQAAILRVKLRYLDKWNESRSGLAHLYSEGLRDCSTQIVMPIEDSSSAYHLFVIFNENRDELQVHLKKNKIETIVHYPVPIHLQKAYMNLGYSEGSLPITEDVAKRILSLPLYPELRKGEVESVVANIKSFENK